MANKVFANGREIACKAANGKSICAFPDVCFTPPQTPATPPGVPLPYPNTAMASDTTEGSKNVKISDKEVMLKNTSSLKTSVGNEAGAAPKKGLATSTNRGKAYFSSWSFDVKIEDENVVRHLDMTTHNHASDTGNTLPWIYADSMAMTQIAECQQDAANAESACSDSDPPDKCSDACKQAQKCVLVPKNKDKKACCAPDTTGHHLVEVNCFTVRGGRAARNLPVKSPIPNVTATFADGAPPTRESLPGFKNYDEEKAPTVCADELTGDTNHGSMHAAGDKIKRAYKHRRMDEPLDSFGSSDNDQSYWTLEEACDAGAKAHKAENPQCNEECIKKQLEQYHVNEAGIPPETPVRSDFSKNYAQGQARLIREGKMGIIQREWNRILRGA